MKQLFVFALGICISVIGNYSQAQEQKKDRAVYKESKNEFFDSIQTSIADINKKEKKPKMRLAVDLTGMKLPKSAGEFKLQWYNEPVSQGNSGMCWCYAATSFFESEIFRLQKRKVKISELHTVYWEYVEKAKRFVKERGNSTFGQGSQSAAVVRIWKQYGAVPADAYTGLKPGQIFHGHDEMFGEMQNYLNGLKASNAWNEEAAIATIKSILNHHIGEPPSTVTVDGKSMTPKEYFEKYVNLKFDDYVEYMSFMKYPYFEKAEYEVPDNWWHGKEYYNVPLEDYMKILKSAVRKGLTVCIGGDVSEPGYDAHSEIAIIPSFDIPSAFIDENARQFRFDNKSSDDDHGIHLVGYREIDGKDWYLIKDSGSGSRNGPNKGFYFYHEDYVKLKMLTFMVHRDAASDVIPIRKNLQEKK